MLFIPTFCEKNTFLFTGLAKNRSFRLKIKNSVYWLTPKTIFLIRQASILYFSAEQANLDHATFNGDFGNIVSKLN